MTMNTTGDGAERRAHLLGRLQETDDRHAAAEEECQAAARDRATGNEMRSLRLVIEELRAAAEDTRRLNAEMRQALFELIEDIRRAAPRE
jgi:hypothetical protein